MKLFGGDFSIFQFEKSPPLNSMSGANTFLSEVSANRN